MAQVLAELRLRSDSSLLRVARAYVHELGGLANLPSEEAAALAWAVEAAAEDLIEHAFDPGDASTFVIAGEMTPATLTVAVHERGLPFDPRQVPDDGPPPADDPTPAPVRAPVWHKIHQAVDEVQWINHGPDGMELRLRKARPQAPSPATTAGADAVAPARDEPRAPEQNYTIRRLQPAEAIGVSQLIYRTYGYTYPNADLYYPDRIVHLNETGELISVVAVDESGAVVGHYALERPGLGPVAESAQAAVSPAHRGRKLMERMRAVLEDEGRRIGLRGIYGQPVTAHTYSQRVQEDFGGKVCGVSLGIAPAALEFKHIAGGPLPQRLSLMLYFKYLQPPPLTPLYVPHHHRGIVEVVYGNLGRPVEFASGPTAHRRGSVSVTYAKSYKLGTIRVRRIGSDTAAEVRRAREDLVETAGVEAVFLELPLAQPGAAHLCSSAESDGFYFSGIGPCFAPDGDVLRLQYLTVPLDTTQLQILSPVGAELLTYIVAERERVGRLASSGSDGR